MVAAPRAVTWVTRERYTKTYIIYKQKEELDPIYIINKIQRKLGWIF
jgi:hypothetical protein